MAFYLLTLCVLAAWVLAVRFNRSAVRRLDGTGDPDRGILVFVEPVRWLFIIWGFRHLCAGLRRGGYHGQVRVFRWSTSLGACFVVPDVVRQQRLIRRAARLAERLDRIAEQHPQSPIHLCGYSSGCYIVLEALRRLQHARIGSAILLAGTVSPEYATDLNAGCVQQIVNVYSPLDLINLLGPLLVGTNDRRWTPACGSVGFTTASPVLRQRRWQISDLRHFYLGDHFTIVSPRFVSAYLVPLLHKSLPAASSAEAAASK